MTDKKNINKENINIDDKMLDQEYAEHNQKQTENDQNSLQNDLNITDIKIDNEVIKDLTNENLLLKAEIQNIQKRYSENAINVRDATKRDIISHLAPIVDTIDLAIKSINDQTSKVGVEMLKNGFINILKNLGVEIINPLVNDKFDSNIHEALSIIAGEKDDLIYEVLSIGMKLKDKLIRPSKVIVTKINN